MKFWRSDGREPDGVTASSEKQELRYHATLIGREGGVVSTIRIVALDDAEAIGKAATLADGHAVDLWQGSRFVDHFPACEN